ncbi:MAG: FAD-dependent pyridine nucleotide-disulfide oxidoreductase [Capsulimonas sp.]|jgi:formate dehydrogenase beta subunit|nr:FAD-dependent pyridine nucleotide-disulfide oxidoreductase [Capsulimonas sp.]
MAEETKAPYRVKVPDIDYWRGKIGCQTGCPVKTDARGYVIAIGEGRYEDAYAIARAPNPFASMCGRICGCPCETKCTRGNVGVDTSGPVSIRALKRFATEQYGVENLKDLHKSLEYSNARGSSRPTLDKEKIAVVGGGVAGMTAAHDLARLGYRVTVFEELEIPGGQMATGVPIYRLSRELMNLEIAAICELGVDLRLGVSVGKDVTIPQLREEGYKAFIIAAGFMAGRPSPTPGAEKLRGKGVHIGIDLLREVNMGKPYHVGERCVVIGGGNVAMDVVRMTVRTNVIPGLSQLSKPKNYAMTDISRVLASKAKTIDCIFGESRAQMNADEYEIEEAILEGVKLHPQTWPVEILGEDHVTGVLTKKVKSLIDATGRFNPQLIDGTEKIIECDTVIVSIGQMVNWNFLTGIEDLAKTPRGTIDVDPETLQSTNHPDVFAVGDIAVGARLFIDGIASAQKCAVGVDEFITGKSFKLVKRGYMRALPIVNYGMPDKYDAFIRQEPPERETHSRSAGFDLVEFNYTEKAAREQGMRCLRCHVNVVFDAEKCILCGLCINICPESILKMVPVTDVTGDADVAALIEAKYGVPQEELLPDDGTIMLMDGTKCIRCALCAKICPMDCISMEAFEYEEALVPVETITRTAMPPVPTAAGYKS